MSIEYRSRYFDDAEAKASFERYALAIFGLDINVETVILSACKTYGMDPKTVSHQTLLDQKGVKAKV